MSPLELSERLGELGNRDELGKDGGAAYPDSRRFGVEGWFKRSVPAWKHTAHTFGFIRSGTASEGPTAILQVGAVEADTSLKEAALRITLDALRVAEYPGGGDHRVLFDFYVQNRTKSLVEHVHFNATYRIRDGERAAVLNFPIFTNVRAPEAGLVIRCFTVNVKNDQDELFLSTLESDVFRTGLKLALTPQPALVPLSSLAVGITKLIAKRNRNVPVQDVYLGLDFGGAPTGARLALGSYVAVQIPEAFVRAWSWSDWKFDTQSGQVLNNSGELIPFNYLILGISRGA